MTIRSISVKRIYDHQNIRTPKYGFSNYTCVHSPFYPDISTFPSLLFTLSVVSIFFGNWYVVQTYHLQKTYSQNLFCWHGQLCIFVYNPLYSDISIFQGLLFTLPVVSIFLSILSLNDSWIIFLLSQHTISMIPGSIIQRTHLLILDDLFSKIDLVSRLINVNHNSPWSRPPTFTLCIVSITVLEMGKLGCVKLKINILYDVGEHVIWHGHELDAIDHGKCMVI